VCLNRENGNVEWKRSVPVELGKLHKKNSMASCTPCSDGKGVYMTVWDGHAMFLHGYDISGKELWQLPLGEFRSDHGPGHSPICVEGMVLLNYDQDELAELIAVDAKTGKIAWRTPREGLRTNYTVPFLREVDNKSEIVVATTTSITGHDLKTGKTNWSYTIPWPPLPAKRLRAVGQPLVVDDLIVMYTGEGGQGRYATAIKPGKTCDTVWESTKGTPYVPAMVSVGKHLYWITDDGIARCAVAATGKELWAERVFPKGVSSSPIVVDGVIFSIAEDGQTVAFKPSEEGLDVIGRSKLSEAVFATPVVVDEQLFIRGATKLYCIAKKKL
jgi:outer membrane protein assembly factor BamB